MNGFLIHGAIYSSLTYNSGHAAFLFKLFFGKRTNRKTEGRGVSGFIGQPHELPLLISQAIRQSPTVGALGDTQHQKQSDIKKPCLEILGRVLVLVL